MSACWMNPDGPPTALIRPALTLVGVAFTLGSPIAG
jgi:hypothetical protein